MLGFFGVVVGVGLVSIIVEVVRVLPTCAEQTCENDKMIHFLRGKHKANEAEVPVRWAPRPWRSDRESARGRDPLQLANNWIPCSATRGFLPANVMCSHFSVA